METEIQRNLTERRGQKHKVLSQDGNAHRRRNFLQNLSINGRRLDNEDEIKEGLVNEFQNLLAAPDCWRPPLLGLPFNVIGLEEASKLEEDFSEKEI